MVSIEEIKDDLCLLNTEDVCKITGWGICTVRKIMQYDKDFPAIRIGKDNQVTLDALKKYLSTRRSLRGRMDTDDE